MRKIVGMVAAVLLALVVTAAQDTKPANDATEKTLIANERALQEAVVKADRASFLALVLADSGVWATKHGFTPLKLLADGLDGFHVTKWDIVNPHVTRLDENSAVVLYAWVGSGTFHGQPLGPTMLASTVWTRRDGKWRAVHHQQTDLVQ
jgi:hypothetical protein